MQPGKNHIPTQEDVAGGYAFVLYSAWVKFGDEKYLRAAKNALNVLYNQKENRFYEAMMPIAAYVAARMNVEVGTNYDVQRFLDWTFDGTAVGREGWGVLADNWGGYDVSGLAGSTVHNGGYGFLMNTFDLMMPLSAMVRYDQRYARAVGKWALNASNAARFCYPYDMPDSLQAIPAAQGRDQKCDCVRGRHQRSVYHNSKESRRLRKATVRCGKKECRSKPCFRCMAAAMLAFLAARFSPPTCRKSCKLIAAPPIFTKSRRLTRPTFFTIPYNTGKTLETNVGVRKVDVYDTVSRTFLGRGVSGGFRFTIPADGARVLVLVPAGKRFEAEGGMLKAGGVAVDYRYGG
jgi:hypothetical protein